MARVMFVFMILAATVTCCSQASTGPAPPPRSTPPPRRSPAPAPAPRLLPPPPRSSLGHALPNVPLALPPLHKAAAPSPPKSKLAPAPSPKAVAPVPPKAAAPALSNPKPAPPPKAPAPAPPKPQSVPPPPPKAAPAPPKTKPTPVPPPPEKSYHVAVEGVVYCRTCKLPGYNKDIQASPIQGAVVKLQCNSTYFPKAPYAVNGTTDKNGYYLVLASPKISSKDSCKVYLVSSPVAICKKPSNYNGGVTGSKLQFRNRISNGKSVYNLYTTGMLIFAPTHSNSCPKTSTSL